MINAIARRYAAYLRQNPAYDLEDLIQEGRLAVIEAEKTYNPARGAAFSTWASLYIRTAMNRALGLHKGLPPLLASLDAPLPQDEELTLLDEIADPDAREGESEYLAQELTSAVREALDRLTEDQRQLIRRTMIDGEQLAGVCRDLGISVDRAITARRNGTMKLRAWLAPYDYYRHKGVAAFNRTRSSVVEDEVMRREEAWEI